MGDVNQILERVQAGSQSERPPQSNRDRPTPVELQKKPVKVGDRDCFVKVDRMGSNFQVMFANIMGRPGMLSGKAAALAEARERVLAEVNAAFDLIAAEDAKFQQRSAERDGKRQGGGPAQVRATGKTERERQKKLNRNKG